MDATYELAAAIIARLKADAAVAAFVGSRVYDRPPDGDIASPYISLGPSDANSDGAECIDALEITMQIDCWSWGAGEAFSSAQVHKLAGVVRKSLHEAEFGLAVNALAWIEHRITRYSRESDGVTNRAIITITASVEIP